MGWFGWALTWQARLSAGYFVEAMPYNELDVVDAVTSEPRSGGGFIDSMLEFFESLGGALEEVLRPRETPLGDVTNVRDQYPRQAWHDVHAMVRGPSARDIGFHFVQVSQIRHNDHNYILESCMSHQ